MKNREIIVRTPFDHKGIITVENGFVVIVAKNEIIMERIIGNNPKNAIRKIIKNKNWEDILVREKGFYYDILKFGFIWDDWE